jgi:hypothetical protein
MPPIPLWHLAARPWCRHHNCAPWRRSRSVDGALSAAVFNEQVGLDRRAADAAFMKEYGGRRRSSEEGVGEEEELMRWQRASSDARNRGMVVSLQVRA